MAKATKNKILLARGLVKCIKNLRRLFLKYPIRSKFILILVLMFVLAFIIEALSVLWWVLVKIVWLLVYIFFAIMPHPWVSLVALIVIIALYFRFFKGIRWDIFVIRVLLFVIRLVSGTLKPKKKARARNKKFPIQLFLGALIIVLGFWGFQHLSQTKDYDRAIATVSKEFNTFYAGVKESWQRANESDESFSVEKLTSEAAGTTNAPSNRRVEDIVPEEPSRLEAGPRDTSSVVLPNRVLTPQEIVQRFGKDRVLLLATTENTQIGVLTYAQLMRTQWGVSAELNRDHLASLRKEVAKLNIGFRERNLSKKSIRMAQANIFKDWGLKIHEDGKVTGLNEEVLDSVQALWAYMEVPY